MSVKFSNNATTELASSIGTSDTSITVVDGSKFPILTAGDYTYVTLDTDTASPTREIVRVTAISGNVLTVIRGQDGTSPASFAAGTKVELRLTAALLNDVAGANPSGEPIGFPDKSQTTITFDSGIRTFSITPTGASFDVYCKGVKYTYTTVQLVTIPNTTGLHFIYFNASGVLSTQMSYFTWEEHAPTAYVYWNATTQQAIYFGDERHGITLDWQTHEYLHRTRGAAIANGFAASGYTTTGLGATDADAQIDIAGGTFFDEDMQVDIVSTNSPVAGTWQQDLSGPARIPVMYLSGAAWVIDSPTNFPFKVVSSVPQYNSLSGSTWSTASVTNNSYFVSWILATNNLTYPVISIISQAPTNQLSVAEAMTFEGLNLNGFPSVEFRPLYKVIYQYKDGFANSVKSSTIAVYDLRSISSAGVAAALVQDHGNLSGLTDDDHPQYVHTSEVRTPSAAVKNSFFPSQVGQTGKFLSTDGTNTVWEPPPSGSLSFTGDVTGSGSTGSSVAMTLAASGVVAGQYTKVTVDSKGRVTAGTGVTSADVTSALGYTPYNATNPAGYTTNVGTVTSVSGTGTVNGLTLTGSVTSSGSLTLGGTLTLTSGQVTTALGYTPANSTSLSSYLPLSGGTLTGKLTVTASAGLDLYRLTFDADGTDSWYRAGNGNRHRFTTTGGNDFIIANEPNTAFLGGHQLVTAGNYTTYAPTKTGGGASGTWNISVSGNAATVTNGLYSLVYSASVPAAGWYRVATTGSDGRGTYDVEVFCTGGNNNPSLAKVLAQGDWGNDKILSAHWDTSFPANQVRITRSASNTFLEFYFTGAVASFGIRVNRTGFDQGVYGYSGSLPAGGDTVNDSLYLWNKTNLDTLYVKGTAYFAGGVSFAGATPVTTASIGSFALTPSNYGSGYFKTVNGNSIIGSGDISISTGDSTKLPLAGGTLTGDLRIDSNWGVGAFNEQLIIYGTYPSMTFRSTTSDTGWLVHTQSDGGLTYYSIAGASTNNWTQQMTLLTNGELRKGGAGGNLYIHTGNVGTYALPITGGTLTGLLTSSVAPAAINTTTPGTSNYGFTFNGTSSPDYAQAITWSWSSGGGAQAGIYVQSSGAYGTRMYLATTDSFATGAKTAISIDESGNTNIVRGALRQGGNQVLHAGNVSTYALPIVGGSLSGNLNLASNWLLYDDTNRDVDAAAYYPSSATRAVRFSFANASSTGTGGNFAGVMHFHPWDGTSGSTGDASYQLVFGSTAINNSGTPRLRIRNGINSSWNAWYEILTLANYSSYALPLSGGTITGTISVYSNYGTMAAVKGSYFGYSSGYGAIVLGSTASNQTTCIGVDPIGNASGSFNGNGSEVMFRNGVSFITPNSANNSYHTNVISMSGGNVGIGQAADGSWRLMTNGGIYANSGGQIYAEGNLTTRGRVIVGDGQTASWLEMRDTDESTRYLHNNSSTIGFVASDANWAFRVNDNGNAWFRNYGWLSDILPAKADSWYHSNRDFGSGTLIQTNINYAVTYGDPFILEIRGNSYGDGVPYDIQYQGYIYSDTIINHGGYSNGTYISGLVAINYNGNLCFWFPRQSYWNGFYVRVYVPYATYPNNRVTSITDSGKPTTAKEVNLSANLRQSLHSGNFNSYAPTLTGSGASGTWGINVTGSAASLSGYYRADDWLRTVGDGYQFKIYGNSRSVIFRTDGASNSHGGGGYPYIWYYGGSGDGERRMILNTDGQLWTNYYGWLQDYFLPKSGGTMSGILYSSGIQPVGVGTNSNISSSDNYKWGYQEAGAWTHPYPDLIIGYHTGMKFGANTGYGGMRFFSDHPGLSSTQLFSIGDGDSHVRVYNNLYVSGASHGNDVYTTGGWFRNHTNNNGIYWSATGWHLYPANGNDFYFRSGSGESTLQFLTSGASTLGYLHYASDAACGFLTSGRSWRFRVDNSGNARCYNNLYLDQNYGHGIVGVYSSTRYQGVFAMGDSYKLPADGTSAGNLYGMAWSYPSAGGVAGNLDSHGMLVLINGGFGSCMSYSIKASGNVTAYSDERLKTNWRPMPESFVERLAAVKVGIYDRTDGERITQVGVSAQSLQRLLPEAITKAGDEMGTLSVSYGNAAMASAVELAKELVQLKRELAELKSRLH